MASVKDRLLALQAREKDPANYAHGKATTLREAVDMELERLERAGHGGVEICIGIGGLTYIPPADYNEEPDLHIYTLLVGEYSWIDLANQAIALAKEWDLFVNLSEFEQYTLPARGVLTFMPRDKHRGYSSSFKAPLPVIQHEAERDELKNRNEETWERQLLYGHTPGHAWS